MTAGQTDQNVHFRFGTKSDAREIAILYNMANNGLSEIWWSQQTQPGENWIDAFAHDILDKDSIAYYADCVLAQHNNQIVGLLIACLQEKVPPADFLGPLSSSEKCLLDLRRECEGSLYLAIVAVHEDYRKMGIARHFVDLAIQDAETSGVGQVFVIVHEENKDWHASFLRREFTENKRLPVGDHPFFPHDSHWILMTKPVTSTRLAGRELK
ncbi:MAG: GNAT family N-acetyltransferase [Pseudomonadota bacterium]